jgi:hypothetical protein
MYIPQEDCAHKLLTFGSGDYYIFCSGCGARWVFAGGEDDTHTPGKSNKGKGSHLSGETRVALTNGDHQSG